MAHQENYLVGPSKIWQPSAREKVSIDNQFLFPTFNENILCNFTAIARQNAINISQFRIKLNLEIKLYRRNSHLTAPRRTER